MLHASAFANSLALLMGVFYILIALLRSFAHRAFEYFFNAQFLGADVAQLVPQHMSLQHDLGMFVVLVLTGWVFGYLWAVLYNKMAQ